MTWHVHMPMGAVKNPNLSGICVHQNKRHITIMKYVSQGNEFRIIITRCLEIELSRFREKPNYSVSQKNDQIMHVCLCYACYCNLMLSSNITQMCNAWPIILRVKGRHQRKYEYKFTISIYNIFKLLIPQVCTFITP